MLPPGGVACQLFNFPSSYVRSSGFPVNVKEPAAFSVFKLIMCQRLRSYLFISIQANIYSMVKFKIIITPFLCCVCPEPVAPYAEAECDLTLPRFSFVMYSPSPAHPRPQLTAARAHVDTPPCVKYCYSGNDYRVRRKLCFDGLCMSIKSNADNSCNHVGLYRLTVIAVVWKILTEILNQMDSS